MSIANLLMNRNVSIVKSYDTMMLNTTVRHDCVESIGGTCDCEVLIGLLDECAEALQDYENGYN